MFNFADIDKYIPLGHLALIMNWYSEVDKRTSPSVMLERIERVEPGGNEYVFHLSTANAGHSERFRIEDGQVVYVGIDSVWMS